VKRILVTGSSGTIGNCLCEFLLVNGFDVTGIDIRPNRWNSEIDKRTELIDLRYPEKINEISNDFDMIVHLAANARVYNLVTNPDLARDNFLMLYNILEFSRKGKINKFIFSSSREVYGNSGLIMHSEDEASIRRCESSYTATKIAGEALIHAYNQCYGIDFVICRFSNVYGRYDYSDRVVPLFISRALKNEDIHIFGRDKILDFTFIDDTISGVVKAINLFEMAKNEVYNIATQKGYSIENVAQTIINLVGSKSKLYFYGNRTGEVTKFVANINKAKAILGYDPEFSLAQGIQKSIDWYEPRIDEYLEELK